MEPAIGLYVPTAAAEPPPIPISPNWERPTCGRGETVLIFMHWPWLERGDKLLIPLSDVLPAPSG